MQSETFVLHGISIVFMFKSFELLDKQTDFSNAQIETPDDRFSNDEAQIKHGVSGKCRNRKPKV